MNKTRIALCMLIIMVVAGLIIVGCETTGKGDAPTLKGLGVITISNIGATSLTLTWEKATDDVTAPENLEYRAYYATVSSITTPEDVEANATPVGDWEKDIATKDVTGLTEATDYYFAVLVRDEDGNMAAYGVAAVFTVTVTFENVPASASSIGLSISGSNMEQIDKTLGVSSAADVWVPGGTSRMFEAVSSTASVTSKGEAEVDLLTVDDKSVTLTLSLYETKLVIPDAENNRIVQIDDMTGSGWTVLDYTDFGLASSSEFVPYDIDFDSLGRIYIANNYGTLAASKPQILRIDDFNDTTPDTIIQGMTKGVVSVAVDRTNELVYYSTDYSSPNTINRCDYDGTNDGVFATGSYGFYGLAVDEENGSLYAVNDESDFIFVSRFNSNGTNVDNGGSYEVNPRDTLVRGSYVYLLNNGNYEILRLDKSDLSKDPSKRYGTQDDGTLPDNPGEFYGPRRFVAILNRKLTVTDEVDYDYKDRLVSFDDTLDGSGWEPYGTYGTGEDGPGHFSFFNIY